MKQQPTPTSKRTVEQRLTRLSFENLTPENSVERDLRRDRSTGKPIKIQFHDGSPMMSDAERAHVLKNGIEVLTIWDHQERQQVLLNRQRMAEEMLEPEPSKLSPEERINRLPFHLLKPDVCEVQNLRLCRETGAAVPISFTEEGKVIWSKAEKAAHRARGTSVYAKWIQDETDRLEGKPTRHPLAPPPVLSGKHIVERNILAKEKSTRKFRTNWNEKPREERAAIVLAGNPDIPASSNQPMHIFVTVQTETGEEVYLHGYYDGQNFGDFDAITDTIAVSRIQIYQEKGAAVWTRDYGGTHLYPAKKVSSDSESDSEREEYD